MKVVLCRDDFHLNFFLKDLYESCFFKDFFQLAYFSEKLLKNAFFGKFGLQ